MFAPDATVQGLFDAAPSVTYALTPFDQPEPKMLWLSGETSMVMTLGFEVSDARYLLFELPLEVTEGHVPRKVTFHY